jgi:heme-degrading monooxygenase HmoA
MMAVLFEVTPLPGRADRYFEIAASLRERLEAIEGFISV